MWPYLLFDTYKPCWSMISFASGPLKVVDLNIGITDGARYVVLSVKPTRNCCSAQTLKYYLAISSWMFAKLFLMCLSPTIDSGNYHILLWFFSIWLSESAFCSKQNHLSTAVFKLLCRVWTTVSACRGNWTAAVRSPGSHWKWGERGLFWPYLGCASPSRGAGSLRTPLSAPHASEHWKNAIETHFFKWVTIGIALPQFSHLPPLKGNIAGLWRLGQYDSLVWKFLTWVYKSWPYSCNSCLPNCLSRFVSGFSPVVYIYSTQSPT